MYCNIRNFDNLSFRKLPMSSTFKKALFLILINFDPVLKKISNLELPKKTVFCNNRTNVNSTMHHGGGIR